MSSTPDEDLDPEQLLHYGVEDIVNGDDNKIAESDRSVFCSVLKNSIQRHRLHLQSCLEKFVIRNFIKAKTIIKI